MPPKLSAAQTDAKLEELHAWVGEHAALLVSRKGSSLISSLRQNDSTEEKKWYMFLYKYGDVLSESQKERVLQTYALLRTSAPAPAAPAATTTTTGRQDNDNQDNDDDYKQTT